MKYCISFDIFTRIKKDIPFFDDYADGETLNVGDIFPYHKNAIFWKWNCERYSINSEEEVIDEKPDVYESKDCCVFCQ